MPMDKTFNAADAEPRIYAEWERAGAFKAGANASRDETFSILLPPPNVTGVLHMGHAFNQTLMDVLIRWHRMRGFDTLWQPGLDHAGIATQMVVERELHLSQQPDRRALGREAFTRKVWEWKEQSGGQIVQQSKRLGASMDWSRAAFTMAGAPGGGEEHPGPNFHDAVIKVFVDMYDKGLIYRGKRLVNWDPHFETAISDLEVENIENDGHMWHFKYPLADGQTYEYVEKDEDGAVILRETRDYISIATTRPETMLGDGAVAVHPSDERYAPIVGKLCEIPVGPKEHRRLIPIITDDYPDPDFGSGAVKITGAHDFNDYEVAKRGKIPMYRLLDTKGAMRADGGTYAQCAKHAQVLAGGADFTVAEVDALNLVPDDLRGLDRFEARKKVVEQITAEGLAVEIPNPALDGAEDPAALPQTIPLVEAKKIMQPFGDRSKVIIEPMLTDQWFVETSKIVGPALEAVRSGETKIMPEQDRKVYFNWLENIEPWCISRQLWWGHQIPVWYAEPMGGTYIDEGDVHFCAASEDEALEKARAHYGDRAIVLPERARTNEDGRVSIERFHHEGQMGEVSIGLDTEGKVVVRLVRDPDVLDTWFSSGLWPIGTLGWPNTDDPAYQKYFPTSTLITGFDIIFFWVARMMMMQFAVVDQRPFDTVYVHALVRDEKGKKMSKSLGNVLDPLELIDQYGADAVRFTLTSMAAMGRDLKLATSRIQGYRNFTTKLWNAVRFAEMNHALTANAPSDGIPKATASVNRWIIGETARVRQSVDASLTAYRFNDAASTLYGFVWGVVCDWYVEFAKPLLNEGSADQAETQAVMAWVLDQCMVLLHPIMPFITEELWGTTGRRAKPLIHMDWPTYTADLADPEADAEMGWVITLIEQVRSARSQMGVPNSQPGAGEEKEPLLVSLVHTGLDPVAQAAWTRNAPLIQRLARVADLTQVADLPKGAVAIPVPGGDVVMPLADLIDVTKEKARLNKSLGKLEKEIKGLAGRVNNPKFAASAPEEVVEEARHNLAEREAEAETLRGALARLAELD